MCLIYQFKDKRLRWILFVLHYQLYTREIDEVIYISKLDVSDGGKMVGEYLRYFELRTVQAELFHPDLGSQEGYDGSQFGKANFVKTKV